MTAHKLVAPPKWPAKKLEADRLAAIEVFRKERMEEPLEAYLELFDEHQGVFEELLEGTVDLTQLQEHAIDLLTDAKKMHAIRYLSGPPISHDDLSTLVEAKISPARSRRTRSSLRRSSRRFRPASTVGGSRGSPRSASRRSWSGTRRSSRQPRCSPRSGWALPGVTRARTLRNTRCVRRCSTSSSRK